MRERRRGTHTEEDARPGGKAMSNQKLEEAGTDSSRGLQRGRASLTPWSCPLKRMLDSWLPGWERIHFCCKPASLWQYVRTGTGNEHNGPLSTGWELLLCAPQPGRHPDTRGCTPSWSGACNSFSAASYPHPLCDPQHKKKLLCSK